MATIKQKTVFVCQSCAAIAPKWTGRCPSCNAWNTIVEEVQTVSSASNTSPPINLLAKPIPFSQINPTREKRIDTRNEELNRVLGGGIVPGSLILLGGEPGIGKSTLLLQMVLKLNDKKCLYVSGEESPQQIKLRAERIGGLHDNCLILPETNVETIIQQCDELKPDLVIIDSIQTLQSGALESTAGSVSQIKQCAAVLLQFAKRHHVPFVIVGHINKDGDIAGPKILEHTVDVVLQFEGDTNYLYRLVRGIKNRFGSTSEIGIFEMQQSGLREVSNPSEMLLSGNEENLSGVAIAAAVEGIRTILVEVQALASTAAYGTPQRQASGYDVRRLNMLLAVLEKRVGFKLAAKDVFLNIAGGLRVTDPALDLSVMAAVLSSNFNLYIDKKICFAAEVSLTGEVRPVHRIEQRISEAEKLGFKTIYIAKQSRNADLHRKFSIEVVQAGKVDEVFRSVFKNNVEE